MTDWKVNKAGQVVLCPLTAYRISTMDEQQGICIRLEFVRSPTQLRRKPDAVQLVVSIDGAESLQGTLGAAIDKLRGTQGNAKH
jgi:hypothetical protein